MTKKKKNANDYLNSFDTKSNVILKYGYKDGVLEVDLQTDMTVDEKTTFIERVVRGCFDAEGEYRPEFKDVIFQITILQMLSDVSVPTKRINSIDESGKETDKKIEVIDIDKAYILCKKLDFYHTSNKDEFVKLYDELEQLVDEKLSFEKERILSNERTMLSRAREEIETGVALVNSIGEKLTETFKNGFSDEFSNNLASLAENVENMTNQGLLSSPLRMA